MEVTYQKLIIIVVQKETICMRETVVVQLEERARETLSEKVLTPTPDHLPEENVDEDATAMAASPTDKQLEKAVQKLEDAVQKLHKARKNLWASNPSPSRSRPPGS